MNSYDLIVIGSGPAGEKAAVKAAYFGKRVALIEKLSRYGGAGVHTGTIPSKTLKETALYYSGKYEKGLYGAEKQLNGVTGIKDFMFRKNMVVTALNSEVEQNILRHSITVIQGDASFTGPHTVKVSGREEYEISGSFILIASGSYPVHPPEIPFDFEIVHDADSILGLTEFPRSITIVGAGVIGCEYATIFSTLGAQVALVNSNTEILPFLDQAVSHELVRQMAASGINVLFSDTATGVRLVSTANGTMVETNLRSGKVLTTAMFLYAAGRSANTASLNCAAAGVKLGKREVVEVNSACQSSAPHIYAAGDVIGFPALASTSMEQGRVAVSHMFAIGDLDELSTVLPYGIYTVPEVSMVGLAEEDARAAGLGIITGTARYCDMPRGRIMGVEDGFLKIVCSRESETILGVHIIGPLATELIHYGMTLVQGQAAISQVLGSVFNFPTLHDLYKYACYDALGNKRGHKIKS